MDEELEIRKSVLEQLMQIMDAEGLKSMPSMAEPGLEEATMEAEGTPELQAMVVEEEEMDDDYEELGGRKKRTGASLLKQLEMLR